MKRQNEKPADRRSRAADPLFDEHRSKYFDPKWNKTLVRVQPGDHYITSHDDEMIVTILGSCVAACIRDPLAGVGGMNHFMLPESETGQWGSTSANMRYGNYAMETLINEILKAGGKRDRLEFKLFGGGNVIPGSSRVGDKNGHFALNYLKYEGFSPLAYDLGGPHPRRIHFNPQTGKVDRLLLKRSDDMRLLKDEENYRSKIPQQVDKAGEVDLF